MEGGYPFSPIERLLVPRSHSKGWVPELTFCLDWGAQIVLARLCQASFGRRVAVNGSKSSRGSSWFVGFTHATRAFVSSQQPFLLIFEAKLTPVKANFLALPIACLLMAGAQNPTIDWGAKELKFPSEMGRIKFPIYVPPKTSDFKIVRVTVVWIPKLEAFPDDPARQAVRITLKNKAGQFVDLIQSPSLKGKNARASTNKIQSQGYLSLPVKVDQMNVARMKGSTSVGVISHEISKEELSKVADGLILFAPEPSKAKQKGIATP